MPGLSSLHVLVIATGAFFAFWNVFRGLPLRRLEVLVKLLSGPLKDTEELGNLPKIHLINAYRNAFFLDARLIPQIVGSTLLALAAFSIGLTITGWNAMEPSLRLFILGISLVYGMVALLQLRIITQMNKETLLSIRDSLRDLEKALFEKERERREQSTENAEE